MRGYSFYRGLYIWIPIMILFWVVGYFCISAFGDDQFYDYAIIATTLTKVSDIDGDRIVPDVPCRLFSYYAVSSGRCVTYSKNLTLEGEKIMACVAVKHEDRVIIEPLVIGDSFDEVKIDAIYAIHFPYTIADMKRTYDNGEPIEYEGADKDDPARFCMWCE